MGLKRIVPDKMAQSKAKKKGNKGKLKQAVNLIATVCGLSNPQKKALKHALTNDEND